MTERLDRIERTLDILASNQVAERESRLSMREDLEILYQTVQLSAENTDRGITQLTQRFEQLTSRFDGLVAETGRILNQLAERQTRTEAAVESLAVAVTRLTQNAEADQTRWRETQAEIRQIWEYLLSQRRNGGSSNS